MSSSVPARRRIAGPVTDSLGVVIPTGVYGIAFGALATTSGLNLWQACATSLFFFTGASQFAFIGTIASGGAPLAAAVSAIGLGVRNAFYGVILAPVLQLRGWRRALDAQVVIDESTAVALGQEGPENQRQGFRWTGWGVFIGWNLCTFLGALLGTALGDPRDYGLDAAVGGAFLALLWPRLSAWPQRIVALVGLAVALGFVPFTPAGMPVIIGGAVAVVVGLLGTRVEPGSAAAESESEAAG